MAHELTSTDHMFSGSSTTPWHGLGTVLPGNLTAAEALEAARLNWVVNQGPVFNADVRLVNGYKLNSRSDNGDDLGIVSSDWEPIQNSVLLEIAESLAQVDGTEFKPVVETAGSLRGGRIVWAMVKTGERVFADSEHKSYLLLSNGHDGKRALRATLTDVRVVCANTLRFAESSASQLYVSHAKGVEKRIQTALETIGWANETTRATFAIYEALAATSVSIDQAHLGFSSIVAPDNSELTDGKLEIIDDMVSLFRSGRGNSGSSAFDFVNAVTDWVDHKREMRKGEDSAERKFLFAAFGGLGDKMKSAAYSTARELAGV